MQNHLLTRRGFLCSTVAGAALWGLGPTAGTAAPAAARSTGGLGQTKGPAIRLASPYEFGAYQHKVQLHSHTTNSDGRHAPPWLMKAYEDLGYVAVAITDHDRADYTPSLDDPGGHKVQHISGVEYSYDDDGRGWAHLLGINIRTIHHADGRGARQAQIDQARIEGGFTYIAHPMLPRRIGWTDELLERFGGCTGVEIFNSWTQDEHMFQNRAADYLLCQSRRALLIATSDYHHTEERLEGGFVVINSNHNRSTVTMGEILAKLRNGNYFSAGRMNTHHPYPPHFKDISVNEDVIGVKVDQPADLEFITRRFNHYVAGPDYAQRNTGVTEAQYRVLPGDKFIRVKATVRKDGQESYAWSNPIYTV